MTSWEQDSAVRGGGSRAPSLLRNFLGLLTGRLIGDLATMLLFVVLSRHFGEEGIGQYSFATVVGGIALVISDFGLHSYTLKEVGRERAAARDRYWQLAASWLLNAALTFLVLVPLVLLMPITAEAKAILILIAISQLFLGLVVSAGAFFLAHERMQLGALLESLANWLVAAGGITVALLDGNLVEVSAVIAAAYGIAMIVSGVVVFRQFHIRPRGFSFANHWRLLRDSLPFAMRQILRQVSMRMDILFIGVLLGPVEVGAYAVAYRLIFLLYILFHLAGLAIVPASSRLFKDARQAFLQLVQRALGLVILIAVPAAVGILLVAPEVVELIFGPAFAASAGLLQALAVLIAVFPIAMLMQNLLEAADRQLLSMYAEVAGVTTGLLAHSLLIPFFGLEGAVAAAILTEVALLLAACAGIRDIVDWPRLAGRLAIALLGAAVFAGLYALLPAVPPLVLVLPAVLIYAAVLLCFSGLRREELGALIGLLQRNGGPGQA